MREQLWQDCIKFHGHQCPGLAIGFRAAELASELMSLTYSKDEEVICISENDACGVDAIQYITGCTVGKGNLIFKNVGKMAFTFLNRETNEGYRFLLNPLPKDIEDKIDYILNEDREKVFKISKSNIEFPKKAERMATIICDKCSEGAAESKIRLQKGLKLCLDCYSEDNRGW